MKIDKVIFGVDDNPLYGDFWPIQAKLVKEPTTGDRFRQYRRRIGGADTGTEGVG